MSEANPLNHAHDLDRIAAARCPPSIRFKLSDAEAASDEWNFNCGPGALCAALNLTPAEIRPHMGDFESKGYTNPTLMFQVLQRFKGQYRLIYRSDDPRGTVPDIEHGLMRIQWGGRWTNPGVPMSVRYRKTHWVALTRQSSFVFDVNAVCSGGWLSYAEWATRLIPWLMLECVPEGDGRWWPTHVIELPI